MNTKVITSSVVAVLGAAILFVYLNLATTPAPMSLGRAVDGTATHLQSASTTAVTATATTTLFADDASGACKARVITTNNFGVNLSFDDDPAVGNFDSDNITSSLGHFQAASTTVVYDAGIFGCGKVSAMTVGGNGNITHSQF